MEYVISPTKLARSFGDVLAKIRYRHDSFVLERNGTLIARRVPMEGSRCSVAEPLASWTEVSDESFADVLEHIGAQDAPPENPWASPSLEKMDLR